MGYRDVRKDDVSQSGIDGDHVTLALGVEFPTNSRSRVSDEVTAGFRRNPP